MSAATPDVSIAVEDPRQDDVRALISELDEVLLADAPPEFTFSMSVEEMAEAGMTTFVARLSGRAVGCGSLRRHPGLIGEIKRMFTRPEMQGRGIASAIVERIEELARSEGLVRIVIETGHNNYAAWRVYERAAFERCGAVLDYPENPFSVFYEKHLT